MANPSIRLINGEEVIDREMTSQELTNLNQYRDECMRIDGEAKAAATAKAALLAKLGITADEAALLLS